MYACSTSCANTKNRPFSAAVDRGENNTTTKQLVARVTIASVIGRAKFTLIVFTVICKPWLATAGMIGRACGSAMIQICLEVLKFEPGF